MDAVGEPIRGYGKETYRRINRRHVDSLKFVQDGVNFMRLQFRIAGPNRRGSVHCEVRENPEISWGNKWEFRYLFVDLEGYPKKTIVIEDNRLTMDMKQIQ